jgi:circadian clock protein KaiC
VGPESLVGSSILLERTLPMHGGMRRRLVVTKVRGATFRHGYHEYAIQTGGIVVYPRIVHAETVPARQRRRLASGVTNLDAMLAGGLYSGTTTLLLGPAGVGKSTCSMTFVAAALAQGGQAAVFTFDEVLENMFERSRKLCDERIESYVQSGRLHAQQVDPAEMGPGAFARRVRSLVEDGVGVIVVDSLNGYLSAMPDERYLMTHLHELFTYLNQHGVVTLVTVAQHGLVAGPQAELDVSYLADTVLLLRYFEAGAEIRQAISVFKNRVGPHERMLRELMIDSAGVRVGEPLRGFEGILTGVPTYRGGTQMLPERDGGVGV